MTIKKCRNTKRKIAAWLIVLVLFAQCFPVAAAAPQTLDGIFKEYLTSKGLNKSKISVAYYNTITGEGYAYNENAMYMPASIYKLPLNMYYYEQEAAGAISPNKRFCGYPLRDCHRLSLQYSDNATSRAMWSAIGPLKTYKQCLKKYGGMTDQALGEAYFNTEDYSAKFILNTLKYLYARQDFFAEAIGYLKNANPGAYFERYIPDSQCTIAQKYGWFEGKVHTAGIVFAPEPYLLCVFTQDVSYAERVIGEINRLLYQYNLSHQTPTAPLTAQTVRVYDQIFTIEAYRVDGSSYMRLRDLARLLTGTEKQFEVGYDHAENAIALTTGIPYSPIGGELQVGIAPETALLLPSKATLLADGKLFQLASYTIEGSSYFALRDLGKLLNFGVSWDGEANTISIDSLADYMQI